MCGGIIGALSLSLPPAVRSQRLKLFSYTLAYSAGRIASYGLAGALMGGLGGKLFTTISPEYGHQLLRWIAALLLIGVGLYLAGWFPKFARMESLGKPLWRQLEPLGQRLLPVRSPLQALGFGLVWGWLPCGLVYSTLLWAASSGSAGQGALYMLAFGAGTLPAVLTTGLLAGWMTRLTRIPRVRQGIGLSLIVFGLASIWFVPDHAGHGATHAPDDVHQVESHPHH
ncbi:MAG: sulfite exporter TauE/SafE family protein [Gammaproteobacteria bacterium]|nr:sulfite exporter TauE/SafE family protein [Gammaproteobacteria bacterium]